MSAREKADRYLASLAQALEAQARIYDQDGAHPTFAEYARSEAEEARQLRRLLLWKTP